MRSTILRTQSVIAGALLLLSACGGGETHPVIDGPPGIIVAVNNPSVTIAAGATYQFTATVSGTTNTAVTWSLKPAGSTATVNVGTITASGLYTAPLMAATVFVFASSVADNGKMGTAIVTVTAPAITIAIAPASPTVATNGTLQLTATVTGASNSGVTWDLPGGSPTGAIVTTGVANATYTAPNTPGSYTVRATSVADTTQIKTATIVVTQGSGFRISGSPRIAPSTTSQFTAFFNDVATNATWTIDGAANGNTVSSTGLFTAGTQITSVTLRATDALQPSRTATVFVSVATQVTLTLLAPANPTLTSADMFTFYWSISPTGVNTDVNWTVNPLSGGTTIPVDYFRGFVPSSTGAVTVKTTTVADPTVSVSFTANITAPLGAAFTTTASTPLTSRYEHAAATLPDGRIVLIGGQRSRGAYEQLTTSEIFNAVQGTFSSGPTLTVSRIESEAVAIDANRVLVTGGVEEYNLARNSAEILNVATGNSSPTSNSMTTRRLFHQMVPLTTGANAGKIAILGGFNGPIPYGVPTWQSTALVELFDGNTNTFTPYSASMKSARGLFTATPLADGRILIVGGYDAAVFTTLASAEIFDPATGTSAFTGSMSKARSGHTATRLADGKVLIVGGINDALDGATAELYNPTTGQFETVNGAMSVPRKHHAAALMSDGRVAIIGGESLDNWVRGTAEAYDPVSRTFSPLGYMATPRRRPTASVITAGPNAGKIFVFGGGAEGKVTGVAQITP
ncbi:MAG: kelch repeat-containing protein [Gemmatimonadaceae bacterium]